MSKPLMYDTQKEIGFDVERAEQDLIKKLEEGAKYKIDEGEEHHVFFERLMKKFNEDI